MHRNVAKISPASTLWRLVFLLGALLALGIGRASAQTPEPSDDDVNRVAKQLYCPVCENIPLDVCPTQACAQWRATIREKLVAGWDEQQIKDYFAVQYGERVLAEPPAQGFSLLVWLIPPLAVLAGAVVWWRFMRRAAKTVEAVPAPVVRTTDPYIAKVEEELKRRR